MSLSGIPDSVSTKVQILMGPGAYSQNTEQANCNPGGPMTKDNRRFDSLRSNRGDVENHVIDEFAAGRISRAEFLRLGAIFGISIPILGAVSTASSASAGASTPKAGKPGATIRVGIITPAAAVNPVTIADEGGQVMLCQSGEFLTLSDQSLRLKPVLATSWKPNADGSVWTFKIREGVKFSDGRSLTADDVVYTYKLQSNPKSSANALSAFAGVLSPDGVVKVDTYTVAFHLHGPNGNFPYLTSSDNYNMIILPKGYNPAKWQHTFIGTGPFTLKSYTEGVGATFVRNEHYWGKKALPSKLQFTFYSDQGPQVLALQSNAVDVINWIVAPGSQAILKNGQYNIISLKSSSHRELSMRCDQGPFKDPRVRRAMALTLDRPAIVKALFLGHAQVGNDSPFAPVFPSTDTSVPQRKQNISQAKQLLAAAGYPSGFSTSLATEQLQEMPQFAQIIQAAAAKVGVKVNLTIESTTKYYGQATFGHSDWLDSSMSLVDYAARSVPNVLLGAPLQTGGSWNAARFSDPKYDHLVKQYVAAVDLQTQKKLAGKIERLLLDETPIIYGYFYDILAATAKGVTGVYPTQVGSIFLENAALA